MSDMRNELKRAYELASLRHEASKGLSGDDWRQLQTIQEAHEVHRKVIKDAYQRDDAVLIAKAKDQILRAEQIKPPKLEPKPPTGAVGRKPLTNAELERRARHHVESARRNDLAEVDARETETLQKLVEASEARQAHRAQDDHAPDTPSQSRNRPRDR